MNTVDLLCLLCVFRFPKLTDYIDLNDEDLAHPIYLFIFSTALITTDPCNLGTSCRKRSTKPVKREMWQHIGMLVLADHGGRSVFNKGEGSHLSNTQYGMATQGYYHAVDIFLPNISHQRMWGRDRFAGRRACRHETPRNIWRDLLVSSEMPSTHCIYCIALRLSDYRSKHIPTFPRLSLSIKHT